jgi:hypothetical protein
MMTERTGSSIGLLALRILDDLLPPYTISANFNEFVMAEHSPRLVLTTHLRINIYVYMLFSAEYRHLFCWRKRGIWDYTR